VIRVFLDGLPYPTKLTRITNPELTAAGYGYLVHEMYPARPRPDIQARYQHLAPANLTFAATAGFDETFALPADYLSVGYHTAHVLIYHQCNDAFDVAADRSPQVYGVFPSTVTPGQSFDPGFETRLIATPWPPDPQNPNQLYPPYAKLAPAGYPGTRYVESCPDHTNGCWDNGLGIPAGGGFYTLGSDGLCRITTDFSTPWEVHETYSNDGRTEYCPLEFAWQNSGRNTQARLVVDTSRFQSNQTKNNYLGVQLNTPAGPIYGGIAYKNPSMTPDMRKIVAATVTLDDCVTVATSAGAAAYGRFPYDFVWLTFSGTSATRTEISVDLQEWNMSTATPSLLNDDYYMSPDPKVDPAIHMAAYKRYLVHPQFNEVADCTAAPAPKQYVIPIRDLVRKLIAEGHLPTTVLDSSAGNDPIYIGGVPMGIETFGRARAQLIGSKHALYVDP
jgi:hypothetical protein